MKKILFLDLEETVIDEWHSMNPVNIRQVRQFIKDREFDEVRIFSFAIWDNSDIRRCRESIIPMLQEMLEIRIFRSILKVSDLRDMMKKRENMFFEDDFDFSGTFKKHGAFLKLCEHELRDCEVVLLDDMVPNMTGEFIDRNVKFSLVNVNNL